MINSNYQLISITKTLKNHFQQLYGKQLTQLILFSSQARGDAQKD